uniref:Flagellar attachment zone protein 1-like n=1 Tax=Nicotiana tabacum TaxID=4097 RepID=A0A1S4A725_TOBAC|nr:PREDICTED: flagellar attachment zone protein 1-like [Nicotiana tabacum]
MPGDQRGLDEDERGLDASPRDLPPVPLQNHPSRFGAQGAGSEEGHAELDRAQKEASTLKREHDDLVEKVKVFEVRNEELVMVANNTTSQVQQKIDLIDQLRAEMNEVQAMADGWKSKMDVMDSEKETAKAKLASVEVQLQMAKEKADKWSQPNDNLRAQLSSAVTDRDALSREYEAVESKLDTTSVDAEEMVAQYKADVEAAERDFEEIHVRCFDLLAEIEEGKNSEDKAKKLYEPESAEGAEGSEGSEGSKGFGDSDGFESAPGED